MNPFADDHADDDTGDTLVVTFPVPDGGRGGLRVEVVGHEVTVTGAGPFRHEVTFPPAAEMSKLTAQLYRDTLELRAPRGASPVPRVVPVRTLA
jgi:hypothetical protein